MIIDKILSQDRLRDLRNLAISIAKGYALQKDEARVLWRVLEDAGYVKPLNQDVREVVTESLAPVDEPCSCVAELRDMLLQRENKGREKYGTTVGARSDLSTADWCQHAIEELLDAAVYLTKVKREVEK